MINIFVPFLPKDKTSYEGKFFKEIILGLEEYSKAETNIICIEFFKASKTLSLPHIPSSVLIDASIISTARCTSSGNRR